VRKRAGISSRMRNERFNQTVMEKGLYNQNSLSPQRQMNDIYGYPPPQPNISVFHQRGNSLPPV